MTAHESEPEPDFTSPTKNYGERSMKAHILTIGAAALVAIFGLTPNANAQETPKDGLRARLLERFDTNKNGTIDGPEREAAHKVLGEMFGGPGGGGGVRMRAGRPQDQKPEVEKPRPDKKADDAKKPAPKEKLRAKLDDRRPRAEQAQRRPMLRRMLLDRAHRRHRGDQGARFGAMGRGQGRGQAMGRGQGMNRGGVMQRQGGACPNCQHRMQMMHRLHRLHGMQHMQQLREHREPAMRSGRQGGQERGVRLRLREV